MVNFESFIKEAASPHGESAKTIHLPYSVQNQKYSITRFSPEKADGRIWLKEVELVINKIKQDVKLPNNNGCTGIAITLVVTFWLLVFGLFLYLFIIWKVLYLLGVLIIVITVLLGISGVIFSESQKTLLDGKITKIKEILDEFNAEEFSEKGCKFRLSSNAGYLIIDLDDAYKGKLSYCVAD